MLNIIFNRGEQDIKDANYVFSPDTYFKYNYEEEWFDDTLVKEMVQDVDASTVMSSHAINSPVLGIIAPERLSGGVKALIIMYKEPSLIVNASACGNNCAKWILEIGKRQDITIRLGYEMEFQEPFEICIKNSGNVIHTYFEFLQEFQEVKIIEG
ncbi:MAG: DUF4869 domain-containing protein [Lachnospiraceae bacterium]|nr:DUF4869 domain-containing protein [Lachnospiraceae bacterium]MDE7202643.1 DUF4869 domain-containing protein [Lachnospiraceae bacterium]